MSMTRHQGVIYLNGDFFFNIFRNQNNLSPSYIIARYYGGAIIGKSSIQKTKSRL